MLPEIRLDGNLDVAALSPVFRGMLLALSYAETHDGIGLTPAGAMNRKFVHWAAVSFQWPGFSEADLYSVNKVLDQSDMPPLWPVRDLLQRLKFLRLDKKCLVPSKRGLEFLANPRPQFNSIAAQYLYSHVGEGEEAREVRERMPFWKPLLERLEVEADHGCSPNGLLRALNPDLASLSDVEIFLKAWPLKMDLKYGYLRRLCWLGLLFEQREDRYSIQDGVYHKTPLWSACLTSQQGSDAGVVLH
ncbi:hypothetical protein D4A92_22910 (plasmid) [Rhizobium rosettiformans]|uniref:DUF2087 domain-containing protein n=1 Tax=Rhizobium rosettiformans TaxID=1368430 RepID=A0ABX7F1Q1_9HYPH|nr:hypothetical protein [Rhizobium rosettiformans]QRF54369.1 hypothetical protein D4A92_22910 [Rhizobium rosettiformans]